MLPKTIINLQYITLMFCAMYLDALENDNIKLKFALHGKERQDFVYNGLQAIHSNSELVCLHDSARPLVSTCDIEQVLKDGLHISAAVLGFPSKATVKELWILKFN